MSTSDTSRSSAPIPDTSISDTSISHARVTVDRSSATVPTPPREGTERARRTAHLVSDLRDVLDPDTPSAPLSGREEVLHDLVETNAPVARSMASRYRNRGIDLDDLEQVALLGLTKAAERFDPSAGHDFLSFAVPTVRGELRRHFRDLGWVVRPPRRVQDLQARIAAADEELEALLRRSPRASEIAEFLGVALADVVESLSADGCFTPASLDAPSVGTSTRMGDLLGGEDRAYEQVEARVVLGPLVRGLSQRDRSVVRMRFYDELTQGEIATSIGVTQAQVSRVIARILADLRAGLSDPPEAEATA